MSPDELRSFLHAEQAVVVGGSQVVEALRRLETEAVVADHKRDTMGLEGQEQVGRA